MRRFIAFIVLAISMLGIVLFNTQASVEQLNWSQEFDNGTEVVYNIGVPDDETATIDMDSLVETFGDRLEEAGATNYRIERLENEGNQYSVRIILGSRHHSNVDNILRSTVASREFSLFTTDGITGFDGNDAIIRGSATVEYAEADSQAYVKVEVSKTAYDQVYADATGEDGDGLIVLWQGKTENIEYTDLTDNDYIIESGYTASQLQSKVLAVVDMDQNVTENEDGTTSDAPDNNTMFYDEDDDKYYLTFDAFGFAENAESTVKFNAESAHSYERILNSKFIDYEITEVYRANIDADYGDNASIMMIGSSIVAVAVVCFYLIVSYGMLAISGCIGIGITVFVEILLINLFSIQVGPAMIIALIASLTLAANMLCVYYRRTRDEVYRGRALGKAQKEGFRKAISTAVDSTILLTSLSIILALIARESIKGFAISFIMSSLLSIIFVFLLSRVLNSFICNSKVSTNNKLFAYKSEYIANLDGVAEKEVPSSMAEKINVEKHGKKVGIAALVGVMVSAVAFTAFGIAGSMFNYSNQNAYGRIEVRSGDTSLFETLPEGIEGDQSELALDNFVTYIESLDESINVTNAWAVTDQVNPYLQDKNYIYFYADLDSVLPLDSEAFIELEDYVTSIDDEYSSVTSYEVNSGVVTNDFTNTIILMAVTLGMTLLYFIIRYRYSLAVASASSIAAGTIITIGLASLTRIAVSVYVGAGILAGAIMTMLLLIPLGNRINQLKNESKVKVTVYEQRKEIAYAALKSQSTQYLISVIGFAILLLALIPLSPLEMIWIYVGGAVSLLINGLLAFFIVVPLHLWIERHLKFTRVKSKRAEARKAKREKLAKANRNRGAEPEEVIIPGIND